MEEPRLPTKFPPHLTSLIAPFAAELILKSEQRMGLSDKYWDLDCEGGIVLFKNPGLIQEIAISVRCVDNSPWVATFIDDSQFDGRCWHSF